MTDKQKRDAAVDAYADAIKKRLDEQAEKGYTGWDGKYPAVTIASELADDAHDVLVHMSRSVVESNHTRKLLIDIGARAMMLHHRIKE